MKLSALTLIFTVAFAVLLGATILAPAVTATIVAQTVKFEPKYMDLDNPEEIVKATVRFKSQYAGLELNINSSTVLLDGSLPIISGSNSTGTKPPEWRANFNGLAVRNILWQKIYHVGVTPNPQGNYVVELTITGNLYDGTPFTGTGPIQVRPGGGSPPPPPPP